MYEHICSLLCDQGARLLYTANRSVGAALRDVGGPSPSFRGEVCLNEKIAYEAALAGAYGGKRTACIFTTEGLYEALDPLMSSAYTGVIGGFVVLCIQETDQLVTPLGPFSKLPVILSETWEDLALSVEWGYMISERHETPVLLQVGPLADRVSGAPASPSIRPQQAHQNRPSQFVKNPSRWAATPRFRHELHIRLNEKVERVREDFEGYPGNVVRQTGSTGLITNSMETMDFYGEDVSSLYVATPFPLPLKTVYRFVDSVKEVLLAEGPHPVMELQLPDRDRIVKEPPNVRRERPKPEETMYGFTVVRDRLGPASSINMAHGIRKREGEKKILAITHEDHFFHSGMAAFVNTIYNDSAFVLLIMTNRGEEEITGILKGFGFGNYHHIDRIDEVASFQEAEGLTVLFWKGII